MIATSVPDWLRQRAQSTPQRLALVDGDDSLTFAELDATVDAAAAKLSTAGVAPGGMVAVLSGNSTPFVVAVHAIARLGATLLPLNLRLTQPELAWQLQDAGASHLLRDQAREAVAYTLTDARNATRALALEALTDVAGRAAGHPGRFDLSALHSVVYTSGTTGTPKGAMLTYGNHLWSAIASALNLGVREDDRWLACLPLFHVGGLAILLRSVIYGTAAIVHPSFEAVRVNAAIDDEGVTMISVVSNMLQRMLDERAGRPYPASLRCVLLGGGPAPEPLLRRCAELGVPVIQTYGLTETASQAATLVPEDALRKLGSAGKPLFGSEVRIVGNDGVEREPGIEGEIAVRGPNVTPGYLNRPDATAQAIRDGWLHTGDVGYVDAEGYLYVLDRRDDLIVSGGENVYPAEIEAVLQAHPSIAEAGVFSEAHERWGQTPVAAVVLLAGRQASAEALIAFCRERLAAYKTPARIEFRDELPRTASGKLMRRSLRSGRR